MAFTITFEVIARLAYTVICMWEVIRCEHFHSIISLEFRHIAASGFRMRTSNFSSGMNCASEVGNVPCAIGNSISPSLGGRAEQIPTLLRHESRCGSRSSSCFGNGAGNVQLGVGWGGPPLQDMQVWRQKRTGEIRTNTERFLPFAFIPKLGTRLVLIFPSAEGETDFFPWLCKENSGFPLREPQSHMN